MARKSQFGLFLKGGIKGREEFEEYGELSAIKKFPNFTYERFGIGAWLRISYGSRLDRQSREDPGHRSTSRFSYGSPKD